MILGLLIGYVQLAKCLLNMIYMLIIILAMTVLYEYHPFNSKEKENGEISEDLIGIQNIR